MTRSTSGNGPGAAAPGRLLAFALALLIGITTALPARSDPVREGMDFLAASQSPSGAFPGTPIIDTVEASRAIQDVERREAAALALFLSAPDNSEAMFAKLAALAGTPYLDFTLAELAQDTIRKSSWGLAREHAAADPLVLASALRFALRTGDAAGSVGAILWQLSTQMRASGGFGFADNPDDVAVTAEILRALGEARGIPAADALASWAREWIRAPAVGDRSALPAAEVALLLLTVGPEDVQLLRVLMADLELRQEPGGSFDGGDVRATALAVQALTSCLPDLRIALPSVDLAQAIAAEPFQRTVLVSNGGVSAAAATTIGYRVTGPGGIELLAGSAPVPSIAPGQTVTVALDLGVQGDVGDRVLTIVVNGEEAFSELDLGNNLLTQQFRVVGRADLVIDASDLIARPIPPPMHQALDVAVRVRNLGTAVARDVHVQLFSGDPASGGALVAEQFFNAVAPGTPRVLVAQLTPRLLDPIHLVARADPENAVAEAHEENNETSMDLFPVEAAKLLTDVTPSLTIGVESIVQGNPLTFTFGTRVTETRFGASYPVQETWPFELVATVLKGGPPGVVTDLARQVVPKDAFEWTQTKSEYYTLETSGLDGPFTFSVHADADQLVPEADETNNVATKTITITTPDLPELWIDPATVRVDPPLVETGATFTVHGTLRNTGLRSATNIQVDVGGGHAVTIAALAPGDCTDAPITLLAGAAGKYHYEYRVDRAMLIAEGSRSNNATTFDVYVGRSDLEITEVTVDPEPTIGGSTAYVTVSYRNIGVVAEPGGVTAHVRRSGETAATSASGAYPGPGVSASIVVPVSTAGLLGDTSFNVTLEFVSTTQRAVAAAFVVHVRNPDFGVTPRAIQIARSPVDHSEDVRATVVVNNTGSADGSTSVRLYRGYREQGDLVASGTVFVAAGGSATFESSWFPLTSTAASVLTAVVDEEDATLEPHEDDNVAVRDLLKLPGEIVVAFDESRPRFSTISDSNPVDLYVNGAPGGLADWARDLEARGFTVRTIDPGMGGVTSRTLLGVDVLVAQPAFVEADAYTEQEIVNIKEYVRQGGGLLFIGEWGPLTWLNPYTGVYVPLRWVPSQDAFLAAFGWTNAHARIEIPGVSGSDVNAYFSRADGQVRDHPAMAGIGLVHGSWTGALAGWPAGATSLIETGAGQLPANRWAAGSATHGAGRTAVVLDSNFFDSPYHGAHTPGYYLAENRRFALQLIDWLAGGTSRDVYPDLVFAPEIIEGPSSAVGGDQVELAVTVANRGDTITDPDGVAVRFYDGDPSAGRVIANAHVGALGVDESERVAVTWNTAHAEGHHVLTAVVDPDDEVREFDEKHNAASLQVHVQSALDLRIDPSDLAIVPGTPPELSVRVHNIGTRDCPQGGRLDVAILDEATGGETSAAADLPAIPARGATTVRVPWRPVLPAGAFAFTASAAISPGSGYDATLDNGDARRDFGPARLIVCAPTPGTRWGGRKTVRLSAQSLTRPNIACSVAVAPEGGEFTGVPGTTCDKIDVETTLYPDGPYVLRVTADDGLQRTAQDVPVRIKNVGAAVRVFGNAPGVAKVTLASGTSSTVVRIPAGARVESASAVAEPVPAVRTTISATNVWDGEPAIVRVRGAIHVIYLRNTGGLWEQISYDEGATWTTAQQVGGGATVLVNSKAAAANASGLHLVYSDPSGIHYRRCTEDGVWTAPVQVATAPGRLQLTATDEGLALLVPNVDTYLTVSDPAGQAWGALTHFPNWEAVPAYAAITRGKLHLVHGYTTVGWFYRSADPQRFADEAAYSLPVQISEPGNALVGAAFTRDEIIVARGVYPAAVTIQRCALERDCTNPDEWLPEPPNVTPYQMRVWLAPGSDRVVRLMYATKNIAYGAAGGSSWSDPALLAQTLSFSEPAYLVETDDVLAVGRATGFQFSRSPGLTPADVALQVGDAGVQLATSGLLGQSVQTRDLADALNGFLSTHLDGDDGAVDGFVAVPLTLTSSGAGQVELSDLEIAYTPATSVAGFSQPPVFSPASSPGVLDSSVLSTLAAGPIAVMDGAGSVRAAVPVSSSGGLFVAIFDGRDQSGLHLPSGRYSFGAAGVPVAEVEIDDIPPTVVLRAGTEGAYGGHASIFGSAGDADHAGTAKNFARYVLDYSTDGLTWRPIATVTSPADGVLGKWDTRQLPAGPATLRLTAYDVAGNSATTSRVVGVSPQAPLAPVIDAPTVAGRPFDCATSSLAVGGVAEPGTTVTVFVNGVAAGTSSSDGRWSVTGVALPEGVASITASAARTGLSGPRSEAITVGRYQLQLALELPEHAPGGTVVNGTASLSRTSVGAGVPLTIRLSARDGGGNAADIGLSPVEQLVSIPASGAFTFPVQLGGPGVRDGAYTITAEVVEGGLVPARAERAVTFDPVQLVGATLTSDKAVYGSLQLVGLEARLSNAGTSDTGDLVASITVTTPGGQVIAMGPYPVPPVPAGAFATIGTLFGEPPLPAGSYVADVLVTDAWANVLATATTGFEVREALGPAALAGTLVVTPPEYDVGQVLQASWSITNGGTEGSVGVSLLLVRLADGLVFARHDQSIPLGVGATFSSTTPLPSSGADGCALVVLLVGNGRGLAAQSIEPGQDASPPVISISGFADGEHRSEDVTPVVHVADASSFTSEVTLNGQPFVSGTVVPDDGEYSLAVHAVDEWGYAADAMASFTIDRVPPGITVSGVSEGELTNQSVFPVVTITEAHAASHTVLLDGAEWDGLPVALEGEHVLEVHAEDLAQNSSDALVRFTIDTTPPQIAVAGVLEGALSLGAVQPIVSITEEHPQAPAWNASIDGQPWLGDPVATEGDWTLVVTAQDAAGNSAPPLVVNFGIDLTAPRIVVSGVTDGLITHEPVVPVVSIEELHPGTSDVLLDGLPFVEGTVVTAEGEHVLTASATDAAGRSAVPVQLAFSRDATPPAITIGGVSEGATYLVSAKPTLEVSELHPGVREVTLDGVPFTEGTEVTADGWHTFEVSASDLAGNTATAAVTFRVVAVQASLTATLDSTPRVIIVVNCAGQPASCADANAAVLKAALAEAGIQHEVVLDGATFLQKIRENRHNVRVLYRSDSSATNTFWELRELTYEGGGVITVNDASPDSDPKIREIVGVTTSGKITNVGPVSIAAGDLGPARTVTVTGSGVVQTLQSPTATGVGAASKGLVVTTHRYGAGRAVTLTLNPEQNDTAAMKDLLVQSVRFAAGGALVAGVPGAPQYVKLQSELQSPAGPLDFKLDAWTGAGLVPLTDAGAPTTPPRTWTFPLADGAPASRTLGVLSGAKGSYTVLGELGVFTGTTARRVAEAHVDVTITGSITELKQNVITATQAIPAGLNDSAKAAALTALGAVNATPMNKAECEGSITSTLQASDSLKLISGTAATDARVKSAQLLRALQALYPTLP